MTSDEAIGELRKFAQQHARKPDLGKTTSDGVGRSFQDEMRIDYDDANRPIQAWIRTSDGVLSVGFNFPRGRNKISFGAAPLRGNWDRVEVVKLPLSASHC